MSPIPSFFAATSRIKRPVENKPLSNQFFLYLILPWQATLCSVTRIALVFTIAAHSKVKANERYHFQKNSTVGHENFSSTLVA